jgi:hypothetical protein
MSQSAVDQRVYSSRSEHSRGVLTSKWNKKIFQDSAGCNKISLRDVTFMDHTKNLLVNNLMIGVTFIRFFPVDFW